VISPAGSEKVIELVRDGMTFGEAAMFIDKPYPVTAQAVGDSKLLFIGREAILLSLEKQRDFALKMLMGISRRLHGLVHDIETYSLCSSVQRVVGYLLSEVENQRLGAVNDTLQLPASKVVVASRLNLTPETLSRAFSELTQKGLIAVSGSKIKICEMEKFRAYCHGVNVA
jgi:CRP-like cAMP-binding protein